MIYPHHNFTTMFLSVAAVAVASALFPAAESSAVTNCIQGCGSCVDFFGKELYDGQKCAITCRASGGRSIDNGCGNELFHLIRRRSSSLLTCKKYCGMCVLRYSKSVYDGLSCLGDCHLSGGSRIDVACEIHGYNRNNEVWDMTNRRAKERNV